MEYTRLNSFISFYRTEGGNVYAFDVSHPSEEKPIVYLDHEEPTPIYVADNFLDFLNKSTFIFNINEDIDSQLPFMDKDGINLNLPSTQKWISYFSVFLNKKD